jgi:hypothetical protein
VIDRFFLKKRHNPPAPSPFISAVLNSILSYSLSFRFHPLVPRIEVFARTNATSNVLLQIHGGYIHGDSDGGIRLLLEDKPHTLAGKK